MKCQVLKKVVRVKEGGGIVARFMCEQAVYLELEYCEEIRSFLRSNDRGFMSS